MNKTCVILLPCFLLAAVMSMAQTENNSTPPEQSDDVVKVYTELVQTDVMVFDKQGHFVKGLGRENFELRVDGKPVPIGFFEQIQAGTQKEEAQLAAARGVSAPAGQAAQAPMDRGRPVFFFLDDMHLSPTSLYQARNLILRYIDHDLKQNDEAEIITASGRLGFLQQLTDNKTVLRAAAERLTSRPGAARDLQRPPMSEYQALQISRGDRDTLGYFVDEVIAENRMMSKASAEDEVNRRASLILEQSGAFTTVTLASLDSLVRSTAKLSGRKLIFLISDGFFLDSKHSDTNDRLRALTSSAARSGAVIYSIDARGLIDTLADAGTPVAADRTGRLSRGNMGEIGASQDGLNALAHDTGGRALFDTNDLHVAVENGLKETAIYYLLAWRPGHTEGSSKFRRLEVTVAGRPDLTVRVRRGFFDLEPPPAAGKPKESADQKTQAQTVEAKLRAAITSPFPERQIPISVSVNYLDVAQKGFALSVAMQVPGEFLSFGAGEKEGAQVDLVGAVFDDHGQSGSRFAERVTVSPTSGQGKGAGRNLKYSYTVYAGPGLYQVRVAARDLGTGRIGSTNTWIEIPDLSKHKLELSSLLVGERPRSETQPTSTAGGPLPDSVLLNIDRRFARDSFLRYVVFIYNSAQPPDVVVQMQVLRNDQPVATTALKKVPTEGVQDLQRLSYAAELPLEGFPTGRYVLLFTAIDRTSRTSASQQIRFDIE